MNISGRKLAVIAAVAAAIIGALALIHDISTDRRKPESTSGSGGNKSETDVDQMQTGGNQIQNQKVEIEQNPTIIVPPGPQPWTMSITIVDDVGGFPLDAAIDVSNDAGKAILSQTEVKNGVYEIQKLEDNKYTIKAAAKGYKTETRTFSKYETNTMKIRLQKEPPPEMPFDLIGWYTWKDTGGEGITVVPEGRNHIKISGRVSNTAGYVSEGVSVSLAGKRLILDIRNTGASRFTNGQLFKLAYGREGSERIIKPDGVTVILEDGYIPAYDGRVEYTVPADFNGRLNFVFYQAELRDLGISAFYK